MSVIALVGSFILLKIANGPQEDLGVQRANQYASSLQSQCYRDVRFRHVFVVPWNITDVPKDPKMAIGVSGYVVTPEDLKALQGLFRSNKAPVEIIYQVDIRKKAPVAKPRPKQ